MLNQEQQFFEQLKKADNILIVLPKHKNGDNIASSLALFLFLSKIKKKSEIVGENHSKEMQLSFLPFFNEIKETIDGLQKFIISLNISDTKVESVKYMMEGNRLNFVVIPKNGFFTASDISSHSGDFRYDLVITVGAQDLESLGKIYENNTEFFYKTPIINIDNNSANEEFGQINIVNLTATSASEVLYSLLYNYDNSLLDEDIATCLLAGIIIKTKSFKSANITPQSLEAAAQLISIGARREEISTQLYRSRSINVLKLWGRALARLSSSMDNRLVWSALNRADFTKTDSNENDLNEIIDELIINIPQAKIIALFFETQIDGRQKTAVLIHGTKNKNMIDIFKNYDPIINGNNYIRFSTDSNLPEATKQIITLLENFLKKSSL